MKIDIRADLNQEDDDVVQFHFRQISAAEVASFVQLAEAG
jgi:hypothetical protein